VEESSSENWIATSEGGSLQSESGVSCRLWFIRKEKREADGRIMESRIREISRISAKVEAG
jgi:hypothetical protein